MTEISYITIEDAAPNPHNIDMFRQPIPSPLEWKAVSFSDKGLFSLWDISAKFEAEDIMKELTKKEGESVTFRSTTQEFSTAKKAFPVVDEHGSTVYEVKGYQLDGKKMQEFLSGKAD